MSSDDSFRPKTEPETSSDTQPGTQSGTQPGTPPTLLVDHLLATEPDNIFLIGCSSTDLYWPEDRDVPDVVRRFDTLDSALASAKLDVSADASVQIAVLNVGSEETTLSQQIGQAVRAFPNRLIVYTSAKTAPDTLFFAFGFRKLNVIESASAVAENRWYEFRLSHYKQSPDWLNAQFWANPERFKLDDDPDIYFDPDGEDEEE
jgi:hypothetical protein